MIKAISNASEQELSRRQTFSELLHASPLPAAELQNNLGLYLKRQSLSRILFMHELYQKIVPVHGVIMDFGTRWGQNLAPSPRFAACMSPTTTTASWWDSIPSAASPPTLRKMAAMPPSSPVPTG